MTLRELFQLANTDPKWLIYYFLGIPMVCFLLFLFIKDSNKAFKINWFFTIICFLVVIPGIFSIAINIYLYLIERQSILDLNLVTQVLPIGSAITSLYFIRKIISFDYIPGFEKLTSISAIIFGIITLIWIADRTQIFAISIVPISFIFVSIVGIVLFIRFGISRLF